MEYICKISFQNCLQKFLFLITTYDILFTHRSCISNLSSWFNLNSALSKQGFLFWHVCFVLYENKNKILFDPSNNTVDGRHTIENTTNDLTMAQNQGPHELQHTAKPVADYPSLICNLYAYLTKMFYSISSFGKWKTVVLSVLTPWNAVRPDSVYNFFWFWVF